MYRIVGADQREYGPATADQVRQWIREGRVNASTITRFELNPWKPLSTFPEFASDLAQAPVPTGDPFGQFSTNPPLYGVSDGPRNHPLAVSGLVASCLSLVPCCCLGPVFGVLGAVLCAVALNQIAREPERYDGKSLAIAGIVMAVIGFLLAALLVLFRGGVNRWIEQLGERW